MDTLDSVPSCNQDDVYVPIERFFVTLALSHAEDIDANRLHVDLAQPHRLVGPPGHLPDLSQYFQSIPGYPHEHYDAVRRFGRFPHRNERTSVPRACPLARLS